MHNVDVIRDGHAFFYLSGMGKNLASRQPCTVNDQHPLFTQHRV